MSFLPPSRSAQEGSPRGSETGNSTSTTESPGLFFICVGAGRGSRFGREKLAEALGDRTVLAAALGALHEAIPTAPLVVVVAAEHLDAWRSRLAADFPGALVVAGGTRRQDSVRVGVKTAIGRGAEVVAIHDAARPLVDPRDVRRVVSALGEADGAILAAKVSDTVKRINGDGCVAESLDRDNLRLALTPQVFRVAALRLAWERRGADCEWTDESALLEGVGMRVQSVVARYPNPKVTTESDLEVIRAMAGQVS